MIWGPLFDYRLEVFKKCVKIMEHHASLLAKLQQQRPNQKQQQFLVPLYGANFYLVLYQFYRQQIKSFDTVEYTPDKFYKRWLNGIQQYEREDIWNKYRKYLPFTKLMQYMTQQQQQQPSKQQSPQSPHQIVVASPVQELRLNFNVKLLISPGPNGNFKCLNCVLLGAPRVVRFSNRYNFYD